MSQKHPICRALLALQDKNKLAKTIKKSKIEHTAIYDDEGMYTTEKYTINDHHKIKSEHHWHYAQGDNYVLFINGQELRLYDTAISQRFKKNIFLRMQRQHLAQAKNQTK